MSKKVTGILDQFLAKTNARPSYWWDFLEDPDKDENFKRKSRMTAVTPGQESSESSLSPIHTNPNKITSRRDSILDGEEEEWLKNEREFRLSTVV